MINISESPPTGIRFFINHLIEIYFTTFFPLMMYIPLGSCCGTVERRLPSKVNVPLLVLTESACCSVTSVGVGSSTVGSGRNWKSVETSIPF